MLEIQGASASPKLGHARDGIGPLRRHLVWQEGLPGSRHPVSTQPHLGQEASFPRQTILNLFRGQCRRHSTPQPGCTGLMKTEGTDSWRGYEGLYLQLVTEKGTTSKHTPTISFRAKYQPYAALCQRIWHQYIAQYDSDDVGQISHLELTSMLDSLGSTLTPETIN
ncbi:hypothetical protein AX16_006651 [Volvariella volvacea WC 439]|nr:hypothetical protein AX16_006651 [Volvariella volvacea WC 439]